MNLLTLWRNIESRLNHFRPNWRGNNRTQHKHAHGLIALLDSWAEEGDAKEQQETLEYLIHALDENRPEGYKLFPPELKGKTW